jgi:hypothetical protein
MHDMSAGCEPESMQPLQKLSQDSAAATTTTAAAAAVTIAAAAAAAAVTLAATAAPCLPAHHIPGRSRRVQQLPSSLS